MEHARIDLPPGPACGDPCEERAAARVTLLIRSAKLACARGEFVVVIRDVSASGISLRGFHALPTDGPLALELQTGDRHAIEQVWARGNEAGYRFLERVAVPDLIAEAGRFPKRQLRLGLEMPVTVSAGALHHRAGLSNFSQQGARIECAAMFAIDQPLRVECDGLPEIVARVRWRREGIFGLVFDDRLTLEQLARFAARVQAPDLLAAPACAAAARGSRRAP